MLYFTRSEMTRSRSNNPFLLARRASALARDYYRFYDGVPSRGFPSLARFEVALSDAMWIRVSFFRADSPQGVGCETSTRFHDRETLCDPARKYLRMTRPLAGNRLGESLSQCSFSKTLASGTA